MKDVKEASMYTKILGEEAGLALRSVLEPLSAVMRHGAFQAADVQGIDDKLVKLCRMAVEKWCFSNTYEAPTVEWLSHYLRVEMPAGMYRAVDPADLVWSVYSYFSWKTLDPSSRRAVDEAFNILAHVINADDLVRPTGRTSTTVLDFIYGHEDVIELRPTDVVNKLYGEANGQRFNTFCTTLEGCGGLLQVCLR